MKMAFYGWIKIHEHALSALRLIKQDLITAILTLLIIAPGISVAQQQQLQLSDFVLLSGENGIGTILGSSSSITGGAIGGYKFVQSTGTSSISGNIYSKGTISLTNSNTVTGKISAANMFGFTGPALSVGSNATLGGNINVNGNIIIGGGIVSGSVTHPVGTTYNGPTPLGGDIIGIPAIPIFPAMPPVSAFPPTGTITPGVYANLKLKGNQTLTLKGTGTYVFNMIENKNANTFVFDFEGNPTGKFLIYVHNNALLEKINATIIGGGSAARIYTEVHGTGSGAGGFAFDIANGNGNGSSRWEGTVWAPYGTINIGSGTGNSSLTGALLSGTQVNIQSGVSIFHAPFDWCIPPSVSAGADILVCSENSTVTLTASATGGIAPYTFTWSNGMTGATINVTPSETTTYSVTVANSGQPNCSAVDAVVVNVNPALSVNAGANQSVCSDENTTTLIASASGGTAPYSYEWFAGEVSVGNTATLQVSPDITTTYTVTVKDSFSATSGNACSASDQTVITVNQVPVLTASDIDICSTDLMFPMIMVYLSFPVL